MNTNILEGNLKKFAGQIKEQWGKLTDDDITKTEGQLEKLAGRLQERYGIASDEAKRQVESWSKKIKDEFRN